MDTVINIETSEEDKKHSNETKEIVNPGGMLSLGEEHKEEAKIGQGKEDPTTTTNSRPTSASGGKGGKKKKKGGDHSQTQQHHGGTHGDVKTKVIVKKKKEVISSSAKKGKKNDDQTPTVTDIENPTQVDKILTGDHPSPLTSQQQQQQQMEGFGQVDTSADRIDISDAIPMDISPTTTPRAGGAKNSGRSGNKQQQASRTVTMHDVMKQALEKVLLGRNNQPANGGTTTLLQGGKAHFGQRYL